MRIKVGTAVAVGICALLTAGCSGGDSKPATTVTVTAAQSSTTAAVPPLRPVAEAWIRDSTAAGRDADKFLAVLPKYADPACVATLTGLIHSLGLDQSDEQEPFTSITQTGTTGIATDSDGDQTHWNYTNGHWLFSCEGLFGDQTADDTTTTAEDETPTSAAPTPRPTASNPVGIVIGNCEPSQEGQTTVSSKGELVCRNGHWITDGH